jgi:protein-L-isoaspartate(D-aspartate) O-methyltransferase
MLNSSPPEASAQEQAEKAEARAVFALHLRAKGVRELATLRAFEKLDRADFVAPSLRRFATRDIALPIGCGQILEPSWVAARMVEALQLAPHHRVLEIGTGSGYLTAALAQLAAEVVSLERFRTLAETAAARLEALGLANVQIRHADGLTTKIEGSFDRILVSGCLTQIPPFLWTCLAPDGILVAGRPDVAGSVVSRRCRAADQMHENVLFGFPLGPLIQGTATAL